MAAFTSFSEDALKRYLIMFDMGELISFEAIPTGIENSNYFVSIDTPYGPEQFVLTITEDLSFEEIPFFNNLLAVLDKHGCPVPAPHTTLDGMSSTIFCGKPTWLFPKLPGSHPSDINVEQCTTIGHALAELHAGAEKTAYQRDNPYDPDWVDSTLCQIQPRIETKVFQLMSKVAQAYRASLSDALPRGIIHGDLFHDNTLFEANQLTGIIDFYHACEDVLLLDIAITLNDWSIDADGERETDKESALLAGYEQVRPLAYIESASLMQYRKFAALRFALTRFISGGDGPPLKDPLVFVELLHKLSTD